MKKLITIITIIAVASLVGMKLYINTNIMAADTALASVTAESIPVHAQPAVLMEIPLVLSFNGTLKSVQEVTLYSKSMGYVAKKYKAAGDYVRRGDVIARLESSHEEELVTLAALDLEKAESDLARSRRLFDSGATALRKYEEMDLVYRQAQKTLSECKEALKNKTITAPGAGILDKIYFEEGTLLSEGSAVADIVAPEVKIVINVTENDLAKINMGDKARVIANAYPDKPVSGTVSLIGLRSNASYNYTVEISLNESLHTLKPGMYATVYFEYDGQEQKLAVPRVSLTKGLQKPEVYVIDDNRAYKKAVSTGRYNDDYIEITGGLTEGTQVVTYGQINLRDGLAVRVVN